MKNTAIAFAALSCSVLLVPEAQARTVHLKGQAADAFIAKHFPDAEIPGPVKGKFSYGKPPRIRHGYASCNVPAMGARSDGAVSTCSLRY